MKILRLANLSSLLFVLFFTFSFVKMVDAQKMDGIERARMKAMLKNLKNAIKDDYYDPNFHGIDLEVRFKKAEERLAQVETTGQSLAVIGQVLMDFNDSHLYFLPPATNLDVEYGWRIRMFGDKCYVIAVQPKSDAEAKGLKPGDQVVALESFTPTRKDLWKMGYFFNILNKRQSLKLTVLSPNSTEPRVLEIQSKIKQHPKVINWQTIFLDDDRSGDEDYYALNRFLSVGNIVVWKMPTFSIIPQEIDRMMQNAKKGSSLILDLRGNGGGYVKTLERLAGYIFDKDVKIAELKGRKPMDPSESKTRGKDSFTGKLIVLVDSNSGSASEIFARLVQLEKRGIVLGDVSAGAVMQAKGFFTTTGANDEVGYGASITNADVIMSDGKSLENVGVIPDELILPKGEDLANQKDLVLVRAIELLGGNISPEQAGKFSFQYDTEWKQKGRFRVIFF